MDNQAVGRRVWEAVGGQKNVKSLVHCATRLRFRLKDESLADTQKLKEDPDVILQFRRMEKKSPKIF